MWLCYLMAAVPLAMGFLFWMRSKNITFAEWTASFAAGLAVSGVFHLCCVLSMRSDVETWSGQIEEARFSPAWVEKYQVAVYRTVVKMGPKMDAHGNMKMQTYLDEEFDHYEARFRNHSAYWLATDTLGQRFDIDSRTYEDVKENFGGKEIPRQGLKKGFHSGSPDIFFVYNRTNFVYPTTITRRWSNKAKAAPSAFSFSRVPKEAAVMEYPAPSDGWRPSNRLLGTASADVTALEWDRLNSRLGPTKKVNLIAVGLGADPRLGEWQESKWFGGKKNDLVLCFGGPAQAERGGDRPRPRWAHVFGWSESSGVKRRIESILIEHGLSPESLPMIEEEIANGYEIKDWTKFDYLTVEPPPWVYALEFFVILVTQAIVWTIAFQNNVAKQRSHLTPGS